MKGRVWQLSDVEVTEADVAASQALVERIRPILAGQPPMIQGAALADCLAIWLAGYIAEGNPAATRKLRRVILKNHIEAVKGLVRLNARSMGLSDEI